MSLCMEYNTCCVLKLKWFFIVFNTSTHTHTLYILIFGYELYVGKLQGFYSKCYRFFLLFFVGYVAATKFLN